jgi:hypothetical protein
MCYNKITTNFGETMEAFTHICEVCDKEELLTSQEAFNSGWDYPPNFGDFGIVSPRTCGDCGIDKTLWWALTADKISVDALSEKHQKTLNRILAEKAL